MQPRFSAPLIGLVALACAASSVAAINEWTEVGPDAGWALRVAIHPTNSQVALLSTVRGIYRTTDGTAHWTLVNEAATGSDFAFDPTNADRVVHASEKVWMSVDGGQSFALAQSPAANYIRDVEISSAGTIYVAGENKVFKSTDHGNTWTSCGAPWPQAAFVGALAVDPNIMSATSGADHLILRATDSVSSPVTSATWRSVDGCTTWIQAGAGDPSTPSNSVSQYAVMPGNSNRILAATYQGVYRSTNGGDTWTQVQAGSAQWIQFDPKIADGVSAISAFGRLMRSTDKGDTWDPFHGADVQVTGGTTFAFDPQVAGRLILASSNGPYLSTDGGLYYSLRVAGLRAAYIGDFSTADDGTVYAVFNPGAGGVFRRDPTTLAWSALNNDDLKLKTATTGFLMSLVATAPGNSSRLYAGVWQANLSLSTDGGSSWQMRHPAFLATSPATNMYDVAVDPDDELLAFAATDHGIWKTINGGTTWAPSNGTLPSYARFVLPLRGSNVVYAISQDPDVAYSNRVYKSTDNGTTWSSTGAMPALVAAGQLLSVAVDPQDANVVYAGHNGGVYKSTNAGTSWTAMTFSGQAAPYATGVSVLVDPDYSTTLTLARSNENSGVVRTTDGGVHWERILVPNGGSPNWRILDRAVLDPLRPNVIIGGILGTNISEYEVGTDLELTAAGLGVSFPTSTSQVVTLTVKNRGPHAASPSELTIVLPAWLTPTVPDVCTRAMQTLHCRIPPLWLNDSYELSLPVAVSAVGGTGLFTGVLQTHETETDGTNNSIALAITASEQAVLALGYAPSASNIDRGESMTLTMSAGNQGPSTSTATTLALQIPAGLEVTGYTTTRGSCVASPGAFDCNLGTLAVSTAAIITLDLRGASPGTYDIVGHVDGAGTDSGVLHTHHQPLLVRAVGDVSIELAESADPIQVGTGFDYTATVRNLSGDAAGVHVTVPVTGARVSSASTPAGTCTKTDAQVDCDITSLAAGASTTIDIHLDALAAGIATASATATYAGRDTASGNNSATLGTTLRLVGDVSVEIADSLDPITTGTALSYTATVRNLGPNAGAVHLSVALAGGTVSVVTPANATCTNTASAVECDFASMANGATGGAVILVTTTAAGTVNATATATFAGTDPVAGNNTATASTTVNAPPPPPAGGSSGGGSSGGGSSSSSGGGGGGGRFDWLALGLLGLLLASRRVTKRRVAAPY
jgi:hypothetical protein